MAHQQTVREPNVFLYECRCKITGSLTQFPMRPQHNCSNVFGPTEVRIASGVRQQNRTCRSRMQGIPRHSMPSALQATIRPHADLKPQATHELHESIPPTHVCVTSAHGQSIDKPNAGPNNPSYAILICLLSLSGSGSTPGQCNLSSDCISARHHE